VAEVVEPFRLKENVSDVLDGGGVTSDCTTACRKSSMTVNSASRVVKKNKKGTVPASPRGSTGGGRGKSRT
jgi:hypothetical protein